MSVLYPNARLAALPCELMRGCIFAENFVTDTRVRANRGIPSAGASINHGVVFDGASQISYGSWKGYTATDYLSVILQFSASAQATAKKLLMSTNSALSNGFEISIDADGIKANHNDGGVAPTACSVDLNYYDGETHTITYLIDLISGYHHLYVDALAANTQVTTKASIISASALMYFSSVIGGAFTGTIHKARIFNQLLTEAEHDLYHADTLTDFLDMPTAVWRCDEFSDDTDSNTIHDRTTNHNDLYKGDRSTSAGFPTFVDDKYLFDFVDDYISNFVTLPTGYTITAVKSTPQIPYPVIQQHNDTTFSLPLTVAGQYWGYLHSLIIHNKALTQIELYHDEYMHQYWNWRGRMWGAYQRLFVEGVCIFAMFLDADYNVFRDYAGHLQGIADDVTRDGENGCTFAAAGNVNFEHTAEHNLSEGTIVLFGDFSGAYADETWIDKGENFKVRCTSGGNIILSVGVESTYAKGGADWGDHEHLAVTFKDGFKAQFYIDGVFASDGSSSVVIDDTATEDLTIGNNNEFSQNSERALKQVAIFNKILTPREIKALYESAKVIGATAMETGNRTRVRDAVTGTAVSKAVDPGGPFQLIDVTMVFNVAPTTSQNITIVSTNAATDEVTEHSFDPSTSSDLSHVFRFDKRFPDGTTITVAYTNTDARNIVTNVVYQLDDSVV